MAIWRFVVIGFVLTLVGYVHVNAQGATPDALSYQQPLTEFLQLAEEEGFDMNDWQVRLRDQQDVSVDSEQQFIELVNKWSKKLGDWTEVDVSTKGTEWVAHFTYQHSDLHVTESIQLFAYSLPQSKERTMLVTYKVLGSEQLQDENELNELVVDRINELGLEHAEAYVQIQASHENKNANENDIEIQGFDLIKKLGAKKVEALNEDQFVSFSAYKSEWEPYIETNGSKMNVQVALRTNEGLGSGTTVTIGTPIITSEY